MIRIRQVCMQVTDGDWSARRSSLLVGCSAFDVRLIRRIRKEVKGFHCSEVATQPRSSPWLKRVKIDQVRHSNTEYASSRVTGLRVVRAAPRNLRSTQGSSLFESSFMLRRIGLLLDFRDTEVAYSLCQIVRLVDVLHLGLFGDVL